MRNRHKRQKRKRDLVKDYLKNKLKNLLPKPNKNPVSNHKND
ncbi:hypothetical protein [uncultured Metabacillus sp.]|nr:hypothetical protein [uncultured Metabacillus sp.]